MREMPETTRGRPAARLLVMASLAFTGTMVLAAGTAPVRLVGVSAEGNAVVIEATQPVAYTVSRPDPLTVVVDMRDVAVADAASAVERRDLVAGARIEQAAAADGSTVARVRVALVRPAEYKVRSARNTIRVELTPARGGDAGRASGPDPITALDQVRAPAVREGGTPAEAQDLATPSSATLRSGILQPPASGEKKYTGTPLTLDFNGADLRAIFRVLADHSGLNIIIDPAVPAIPVDILLRDIPWDQALEILLRTHQLGYEAEGTVVRIAPLKVLEDEQKQRSTLAGAKALAGELTVQTFSLSYARATDLSALLVKSALSPRGEIQVDPRTNTLILTDLPERLQTAASLIATLDRPEPQVEVEARVVQTTRDFARAIGVQWGLNGRVSPDIGNTTPLAFPNRGTLDGRTGAVNAPNDPRATAAEATGTTVNLPVAGASSAIGLALGAVNGAFNLDVALSALERSGKGRVLSTPRLTTQNNIEAEVAQGIQVPIQVVANNTVTVTFKEAVLLLKVTPQITSANTVIMKVTLENAAADFSRQVNGIPPIDTQRAVTQVQVDDGATTVIGGIFVSREQVLNERTPLLHRVPLLGWLFRRDSIADESRELLIFITPRILKGY